MPTPGAMALRRFMARVWHRGVGAVSGERRARSAAWVRAHADGLQLLGALVAGVLLFIVSISWWSFLIIGVVLAAYEVAMQWAKVHPPEEPPVEPAPCHEVEAPAHVGDS